MLILASTSPYRRELLQRLRLPFDCARPQVEETPLPGEAPDALARRLARAKAAEVAARHPGAWVIGSDQVADLDGRPLGKSGGRAAAIAQLSGMSGRVVDFHTAVCLLRGDDGKVERNRPCCSTARLDALRAWTSAGSKGSVCRQAPIWQPSSTGPRMTKAAV